MPLGLHDSTETPSDGAGVEGPGNSYRPAHYSRNDVVTDIKSFLGPLIQMNMMATHNINMELHYLNKDRLLHWLLVKHRDTEYGFECVTESDSRYLLSKLPESSFPFEDGKDDDDDCDGYGEKQKQETSSVDQQRII